MSVAPATLLVLDDDPVIIRLIETCFVDTPHRLFTAERPEDARALLAEHSIDLVLTDIKLPGIEGFDVLSWPEYKARNADCIVITGYATTEVAIRALQLGVTDLIRKPFEVGQVIASVERALERRELTAENRRLLQRLTRANEELEHVVTDRTRELRNAYEHVLSASRQIERLEQLKSQFVGIVTHEFNTPLNVIKGYVGLLHARAFGELSPDQIDALNTMEREVDRIVELLAEVVKIQSLEDETFAFAREPLAVLPLAHEVVETITPFFVQRNQQFILNVPGDLPHILGNARQLSIVIKNLLVNAIRFTPDGGLITFSAQAYTLDDREGVLFLVRDTGVGIPEGEFERVFSKFYEVRDINLHSTGKVEFGSSGLGLGLSIARRIVAHHDGRIWVESTVGEGSRFYFFVPEPGAVDAYGEAGSSVSSASSVDIDPVTAEARARALALDATLEELEIRSDESTVMARVPPSFMNETRRLDPLSESGRRRSARDAAAAEAARTRDTDTSIVSRIATSRLNSPSPADPNVPELEPLDRIRDGESDRGADDTVEPEST